LKFVDRAKLSKLGKGQGNNNHETCPRAQLNFTERLVARFVTPAPFMQPLETYQAQFVAIIAMLRSIGHVFEKVDCYAQTKKAWAADHWREWRRQPIFTEFIEPKRNQLLKEFQHGLSLGSEGISSPAYDYDPTVADPASPRVDFDAE
jgi:hypothetical protein